MSRPNSLQNAFTEPWLRGGTLAVRLSSPKVIAWARYSPAWEKAIRCSPTSSGSWPPASSISAERIFSQRSCSLKLPSKRSVTERSEGSSDHSAESGASQHSSQSSPSLSSAAQHSGISEPSIHLSSFDFGSRVRPEHAHAARSRSNGEWFGHDSCGCERHLFCIDHWVRCTCPKASRSAALHSPICASISLRHAWKNFLR